MPIRVYYEVLNQKGTPALYSDNFAQRPAAGFQGRIFNSPDTGQIFYDTGTTWTLLADAGVGSGSLASVCANGNTTATGIQITAGGLSTNSLTSTNLTAGSIPFIGTGGLFSQDNTNFFWDNTNKYLGINTNTPSVAFDIHSTNNVQIQLNNTSTFDSKIAFLNASVGKWRIGNLYSGGANLFHIYNNAGATLAMQINSSNAALFYGSLSSNSFIQAASGITLTNGGTTTTAGATNIGGLTAGLSIALASGFNQTLTFPTGVAYTYTFPSATGTLINGTSFSSGVLPKYSSTSGVLTASMLSDDGTTLISTGATRSNLYLQAANNTYYSFLAFTNGSNGSYGGISYNNAGQYMQFEVNSSEYMRYFSNGNLRLFTSSATDNGYKLQVEGQATISTRLLLGTTTSIGYTLEINGFAWYNKSDGFFSAYGYNGGIVGNIGIANQLISGGSVGNFAIDAVNNLIFSTNATERMRITTGGVLNMYYTFNSTANGECFIIDTNPSNSGSRRVLTVQGGVFGSSGDSSSKLIIFQSGNGTELGSIRRDGGSGVSYLSSSDYRLKEDLKDYDALQIISNIKTYDYKWKDVSLRNYGVMAHELQEILPYAVGGVKDEVDDNGNIKVQGVDYSKLVPITIKAIQQLDDRLTALENLN